LDKTNTDLNIRNQVKDDTLSPQNITNDSGLESEDPGYAVNYGRTVGNHHFEPLNNKQTQNYIDHVSEPVNNTYI
jgi:hypothetical protein